MRPACAGRVRRFLRPAAGSFSKTSVTGWRWCGSLTIRKSSVVSRQLSAGRPCSRCAPGRFIGHLKFEIRRGSQEPGGAEGQARRANLAFALRSTLSTPCPLPPAPHFASDISGQFAGEFCPECFSASPTNQRPSGVPQRTIRVPIVTSDRVRVSRPLRKRSADHDLRQGAKNASGQNALHPERQRDLSAMSNAAAGQFEERTSSAFSHQPSAVPSPFRLPPSALPLPPFKNLASSRKAESQESRANPASSIQPPKNLASSKKPRRFSKPTSSHAPQENQNRQARQDRQETRDSQHAPSHEPWRPWRFNSVRTRTPVVIRHSQIRHSITPLNPQTSSLTPQPPATTATATKHDCR